MPQPKPITKELLLELNNLPRWSRADPNNWHVIGLRRRIEKLKNVDMISYFDLMGAFGAVTWDVNQMRFNHERAVSIGPTELRTHDNYACSLLRMGFFSEAIKKLEPAAKIAPKSALLNQRLAELSLAAGKIRQADIFLEKAVELQPGIEAAIGGPLEAARHAVEVAGISDESAEAAINTASEIPHRHGLYDVGFIVDVLETDELPIVMYSLTVPPSNQFSSLNTELAGALASDSLVGKLSANLVVRFVEAVSDGSITNRVA